jgi:uncharacterized Zn finger protein (UPF0148 family)
MKTCEVCGEEICTRDGENRCPDCGLKSRASRKRKAARLEREELLRSFGLVKVRGAMGGTYWE